MIFSKPFRFDKIVVHLCQMYLVFDCKFTLKCLILFIFMILIFFFNRNYVYIWMKNEVVLRVLSVDVLSPLGTTETDLHLPRMQMNLWVLCLLKAHQPHRLNHLVFFLLHYHKQI